MATDPRYAEATECQDADVRKQAVDLLLETRTRPLLRVFVITEDEPGYAAIATATRINGRPIVYEMGAPGCDPVLLDSLLMQHGQTTH